MTLGEMLPNEQATPRQLLEAMVKTYGAVSMTWDPLTIRMELVEDGYENIPGWAFDKLFAAKMSAISSAPWTEWSAFLACAQAFNNNAADFMVARVCSPSELAWTVRVLNDLQDDEEFSSDIQAIMAAILLEEGIVFPPTGMDFLSDEMARLQIYNKDAPAFVQLAKQMYETHKGLEQFPDSNESEPLVAHTIKMLAIDAYLALWKAREEYNNDNG